MTDKKKKTDKVDIKKQIEELEQKCAENLAGWQRAQADYHNLQKEVETKKADWVKYANAELLEDLLPIYDNMKMAIAHIPEDQQSLDWVVGVSHIKNQFQKFLEDNNIEEIETVGKEFDPELHEAVEGDGKNEIIKKEIKAGYKLNGKVLYPAKVALD